MKTLPREPWRGGQICGEQTNVGGWSEGPAAYCGEFKKLGSPVCDEHDRELREDNDGVLPRFSPGNDLGLTLAQHGTSWFVFNEGEEVVAAGPRPDLLRAVYGFDLFWEPEDERDKPVIPTDKERADFEAQS